ncbi:hypothetical protein C5F61_00115, partial [Photobacterium damselae subsp. damselae]|uniref:hypothetical protein n=1 Tax=Photobacterium damselae TaxID=38293 RepID=UPI000D414D28
PSGGWNGWNNGWFHNVLTFDNVYAEGGEAGIWGCTMCGTYMGVTCQGQKTDGANNDVLPEGMPGVGLFLDSGKDNSRNGWNNTVISYYSENTNIGIYAKNQRYTGVDGMFMQGGSSSNRATSAIVADNSLVMAKGVVGQDYFSDGVFRAINGGKLVLEGGFGGPMSGVLYSTDGASDILMRGQCDLDKDIFTVGKSLGVAEKSVTYPTRVPEYGTVKFYVLGIYDGYVKLFGEMTVQRWNGSVAPEFHWMPKVSKNSETGKWDIVGAQPPGVDITVSTSGVVTITLSGSQSLTTHIMMQIVGGHDISNKAQVLEGV